MLPAAMLDCCPVAVAGSWQNDLQGHLQHTAKQLAAVDSINWQQQSLKSCRYGLCRCHIKLSPAAGCWLLCCTEASTHTGQPADRELIDKSEQLTGSGRSFGTDSKCQEGAFPSDADARQSLLSPAAWH